MMNSSRGKVILQMALDNNARKIREKKMQLTHNWLLETKGTEEQCNGKENRYHLSSDFVECSVSSECTLSMGSQARIPDFTYHHKAAVKETVCQREGFSLQSKSSRPLLSSDNCISIQSVSEGKLLPRKKSPLPFVQHSLLHQTEVSDHLCLMEDLTHEHTTENSMLFPLLAKDSISHLTEDVTDLNPNENSLLHLLELSENSAHLHLIENSHMHMSKDLSGSHILEDSTELQFKIESGQLKLPEGSTPIYSSKNFNNQLPKEDSARDSTLCLTEDSVLNFTQASIFSLTENFDRICNTDLTSQLSLQQSDVSLIYIMPAVTSTESIADDTVQPIGQASGLPNNCDVASQEFPGKQLSLFTKANKKVGCKQVYDKVNYCTFCLKPISSKITRHLLNVHKDQREVLKVLLLPKRSKERMNALSLLTSEGNFKHNSQVLKDGKGEIVVACRNPLGSQLHSPNEYLPCELCKKFILKSSLWIHHRKCIERHTLCNQSNLEDEKLPKKYGYAVSKGRSLLNSALLNDDEIVIRDLLQRMNDDKIKKVVTEDDLIRRYSALRMESLGSKGDQKLNDVHRVSQGARTLARLVLECRKIKPIKSLNELIEPENFDLIVAATKKMAFAGEKPASSLGRLMGNIMGHVISIKVGNALRCNDQNASEKAANFRRLFEAEWNYRVNAVGTRILNNTKRQKVATIPLTEDLKTLRSFILSSMTDTANRLEKLKLRSDWTWLAKLTMSRLILFNKRRRAEVKDLKVDDYLRRPKWNEDENGEMEMALSKTDAVLAKRMDMVIAAGKSRKNVDAYVLLPPDAQQTVELLIRTRADVGVPSSNPYIFSRMSTDTPFSGNAELQEVVSACKNILHPNRITSTSLRKYIATVSQVLDMTDNELELLARHLGHDAKTHKEYYRLSHHTVELSKVSQLLLAVDSGNINEWKGRKLSDIAMEDMELSDEEDGDGGDGGDVADSVECPTLTESIERVIANVDEQKSEDQEKILVRELSVRAKAVTVPESQLDTDDGRSSTDSFTMQIQQNKVGGKREPWSASDLKTLREACRQKASPLSFNEIRTLQALHPSLRKRTLAQIKSRAWALMKH